MAAGSAMAWMFNKKCACRRSIESKCTNTHTRIILTRINLPVRICLKTVNKCHVVRKRCRCSYAGKFYTWHFRMFLKSLVHFGSTRNKNNNKPSSLWMTSIFRISLAAHSKCVHIECSV